MCVTDPRADERKSRIFYGWYVVAVVFVIMTVSCGLGFYNLSVYLKAFVTHNGFSVEATSTATSIFFLAAGVSGLGVATLIDRFDARWCITGSTLLMAIAIAGAGYVTSLWQLHLFYAIFGVGYSGCALIPGTTIVARWFTRRRAQAIAYASTGLSLGGILFTPLSVQLIESLGLKGASPLMAIILIIGIIPITWLLLRSHPGDMGLTPDGDAPRLAADGSLLPPDGTDFRTAIRSRFFLLFTIAYVFAMMAQVGSLAHQFRLISLRTGSDHWGAIAVSVMAASSITGRLIGGSLLRYVPHKTYVLSLFTLQGIAFVFFATTQGTVALLCVSALFGSTVGNLQMMQPLVLAEAFGLKAYARILSLAQMVTTCANALGPILLGVLYERAGGYGTAYLAIACLSVLAFIALYFGGPVPTHRNKAEEPYGP